MVHGKLAGIRPWEEPTMFPGAFLGRSGVGNKGWGVLWPPI